MANTNCCTLVGNFFQGTRFEFPPGGCFIAVNNNINTEFSATDCSDLLSGYSVGSLNLSGYAGTDIYKGCPGRAGVQVLWHRKYDCSTNSLYFIFAGQGRSFMSGNAEDYVELNKTYTGKETQMISASSQSGPSALYSYIIQQEGLGMKYSKGPITFDTSDEAGCTLTNMGIGTGPYYLQSFNIELVPGSIPVANYTFAYNV